MPKVPGWRDPTEYPQVELDDAPSLGLEFLRRSSRYQELWEEVVAPYFDADSGL